MTAGKGLNDSEAIGGAIGEAIERYCASHPAVRRIKRARLGELLGSSISPNALVPFSASQYASEGFAYPRWTDDTVTGWLPPARFRRSRRPASEWPSEMWISSRNA